MDLPQDLAKAFANFGAVTAVRVSQRKGHHAAQAWVELDSIAAASRACRSSTTVVSPVTAFQQMLAGPCNACGAPCSMQLQLPVITLQEPAQASTRMQVVGGQVLAVQASQTAIHTSTLPCSGSSSPTRSPSSSHQGPVAASATPPDAAASLKSTGSPDKPAMQPYKADSPDKPPVEPQQASSPAAPEHPAAGAWTVQASLFTASGTDSCLESTWSSNSMHPSQGGSQYEHKLAYHLQ